MSVFLRWGVFGILGVAALLYAYNASKRMADAHARKSPPVAEQAAREPEPTPEIQPAAAPAAPKPAVPVAPVPARCEIELTVAKRAIEMKQQGEPLDRVLRMQEIAWEESAERRKRLEGVAARYYGYEGGFSPDALRSAVVSDCQGAAPAP